MDDVQAKQMTARLLNREISGWLITEYIHHGKSAAVFKGSKGSLDVAVKIFDSDLVEEFGPDAQLERIRREVSLVGRKHPHLET